MPPAQVQTSNGAAVSNTQVTVSFSGAPTAGDMLYVSISFDADPGAFATIPTGWSQIGTVFNNGGQCYQADFYKPNCTTHNSEQFIWTNTVTNIAWSAVEASGLATVLPLEVSGTNTGSSNTPSSPNITTTNANDFIIAAFSQNTNIAGITFSAPTNSFTHLIQQQSNLSSSFNTNGEDNLVVAAGGTYSTKVTSTSINSWTARITAFSDTDITVSKQQSDTATGANQTGIVTQLIGFDRGAGAEATLSSIFYSLQFSDGSGRGADGFAPILLQGFSDSGVGDVSYSNRSFATYSDSSGIGNDYPNCRAFVSTGDSASGNDNGTTVNSSQVSESGVGTDSPYLIAFAQNSDSASGQTGFSYFGEPFVYESASGYELSQLSSFVPQSDSGIGVEAGGSETQSTNNPTSETGLGAEGYSLTVIVPSNVIQISGNTEDAVTISGTIE